MKRVIFISTVFFVTLYGDIFSDAVSDYRKGNYVRALNGFYLAAKEQDDAAAMFNLALMYEKGIGVGRDIRQALAWYRKAAEEGSVEAMYNLALLLEEKGDYREAEKWYVSAAKAGHSDAMNNLAVMYWKRKTNDPHRYKKVRMLLEEAAAIGNEHAARNLQRLQRNKF